MSSLEEEIEQKKKFCEKKSIISFVNGRKEYINNIISTITNIVCLVEFTLESKEYPLIVTYLIGLANIIFSSEFKMQYYKYHLQALQILYTVLTFIYSIIIIAEVSSHYLYISNLTDSNTMLEYSIFKNIIGTYYKKGSTYLRHQAIIIGQLCFSPLLLYNQ